MNTYFKLKSLNIIKDLISRDELVTKCHRFEKQLDIAVNTLEEIERKSDKFDNSLGFIEQLDCIKADCQEALYYLKEIDEVLK